MVLDLFTAYHDNKEVDMTIREQLWIQEPSF